MQRVKYRNTSNVCIPEHWDILEHEAPFIVPSFLSYWWSPECQLMKNYCHFKELGGTVPRKPLLGAGLGFLNLNFQLTGGTLRIAAVLRLFWIAVRWWIVTHHSAESWAEAISTWLWQWLEGTLCQRKLDTMENNLQNLFDTNILNSRIIK